MWEITIPEDLDMLDIVTEKPTGQKFKFVEFVRTVWLPDARFSKTSEALEQQRAIRDELRGKEPKDKMLLHPNDYNLLLEVSKEPQYPGGGKGYGPLAYQCIEFIDVVKNAKKVSKKPVNDEDDERPAQKRRRDDED